ncbi:aminoglycoside phosphotransferase family protein [Virgibacillus necropolis]|uniref:aminoglycoside phosphotransferase family protein n=1 Tax=Virgibacillus necropolis TaxID=163877 RepID=UPI00384EB8ED
MPNLQIDHIKTNNSGWDNDIIVINQKIVFRFPKTTEIANKVIKEVTLLESILKQHPIVNVPKYGSLYDENKYLKCVYYRYIEGVSLSKFKLIPNRTENAKLLGEFLTKLHSLENPPKLITDHTFEFWNKLYESVKKEVYPFLNEDQQEEVTETFGEFLSDFSTLTYPKTVIHGDLSSSNIIFDEKSKNINGIIDFTDAQIGDPAFDFAGFYWDYGPEFTKEVLSYYTGTESSEALYKRVEQFYGLQPVFHELLNAVQVGNYVNWKTALSKFLRLKNISS